MEIHQQFVTYKIAQKLRDKKFNEDCLGYYKSQGKLTIVITNKYGTEEYDQYYWWLAPTWQQAIEWCAKSHNLHILPIITAHGNYQWQIWNEQHKTGRFFQFSCDSKYTNIENVLNKALDLI